LNELQKTSGAIGAGDQTS